MNAIEREVSILDQHWDEFILGEQEILHWLINPADTLLVNAFVKVKEQFAEESGTWFIQLTCPFDTAATYGYHLAEELNHLIREGIEEAQEAEALELAAGEKPDLADAQEQNTWQPIDSNAAQSGFHALFTSINSVLALFDKSLEQLTIVINPSAIKQVQEYRHWWQKACSIAHNYATWPAKLKLLALDNAAEPILTTVFSPYAQVAKTQTPPLNLNAAAQKLAEQTHDGSDSAQLRLLLVKMNGAITEQNAAELKNTSEQALEITRNNQWPDMTTTVLLTRAGGWLNLQKFPAAIIDYQQAQLFARMGIENSVPGCDKLLLQALLFEGTGYFLAEQLDNAARAYEVCAQQAALFDDAWICLEAWRMAAFSAERLKQTARAWQFAIQAVTVGKAMTAETRQQSTLGFVGQAMLRLNGAQQNEINSTFSELLGSDWLQKLEGAA